MNYNVFFPQACGMSSINGHSNNCYDQYDGYSLIMNCYRMCRELDGDTTMDTVATMLFAALMLVLCLGPVIADAKAAAEFAKEDKEDNARFQLK